jgi:c-di-GMP-binding flagellar brake protein YcgR
MPSKITAQAFPFRVGDILTLRRRGKEVREPKFVSRILGYDPGRLIIIKVPKARAEISNLQDVDLIGVSSHEGIIYSFRTRIRKHLEEEGLVLLHYPSIFQEKRIRMSPRIRVDIETTFRLQLEDYHLQESLQYFKGNILQGAMVDISEGGCCILIHSLVQIPTNVLCTIDFVLPDGQGVEELEALIISSKLMYEQTSEVGLQFYAPAGQLKKVAHFCHLASMIQGFGE